MKFDIIIGNPPYQDTTEGGSVIHYGKPIYLEFINNLARITDKLVLIIPNRWYSGESGGFGETRRLLLDCGLSEIHNYANSQDVFDDVMISGGISIIKTDKSHKSRELTLVDIVNGEKTAYKLYPKDTDNCEIIKFPKLVSVVNKVQSKYLEYVSEVMLPSSPFGIPTYVRGEDEQTRVCNIPCLTSEGVYWISKHFIKRNNTIIDKYKVIIGYKTPGSDFTKNDGTYKVLTQPRVLLPGYVCTQTYNVVNYFNTLAEAERFVKYLKTKFSRALVLSRINGTTISKERFTAVPIIPDTVEMSDTALYKYFELNETEIEYIENLVRPMNNE